MKTVLTAIILLVLPSTLMAQTVIVTDTSHLAWSPSPDDQATFGTPPQPLVTSYRAELYLKANVTVNGTTVTPTGNPAITIDQGKPTVDGTGAQNGPPLKSSLILGQEYYAFLRAVGPGGVSPQMGGAGPFGFPAAPRTVTSVRLVP